MQKFNGRRGDGNDNVRGSPCNSVLWGESEQVLNDGDSVVVRELGHGSEDPFQWCMGHRAAWGRIRRSLVKVIEGQAIENQ